MEVCRLPDGASSTQPELVALLRALGHAVEEGGGAIIIHCDSVPAIKSIMPDPLYDNTTLLTSIHVRLTELEAAGRNVHVNWLPSHAGVEGNEAADSATYEEQCCPQ